MSLKMLRLPEVKYITGLSRSSLYLHISQGTFPKQVPLGPRCVGWLQSEVDAWLQKQIDSRKPGA